MKYLLGVDIGTSGTKTILINSEGLVVASSSKEYPLYQPFNGWAEQDPEDWWNAAIETISEVITKSRVNAAEIAGIGLTGQMHGLVMLDANGAVLRRSIIWCDQRTGKEVEELTRLVGRDQLIKITANPAITGFTAAKILWVRANEPEIFKKCKKILLPKDYVRYKLTGKFATDVSDASGMQLLDIKNRCWSNAVLTKLNLDLSLLPEVYESPEITGSITQQVAQRTGLVEGTPVVAGAGDNAAAAVGVGVVLEHKAFTTIGTSGVVYAHTSEMHIDPKGRVHTFCSAVPGEWHVMGVTQAAGLSLQWFRNNACQDLVEQARKTDIDPYVLMDAEANQAPIGSNKLIFLPYLMGERTPHLDPECRGVFFGLSASHQRSELIRSVMEGVVFSLYDCVNIFKEMDIDFSEMLICGGGGKSELWRSMLADVFECKVQAMTGTEGPAFGSAILASVGAGIYPSVAAACSAMLSEGEKVAPDHRHHEEYEKYYSIYRTLYSDLQEEWRKLAAIG